MEMTTKERKPVQVIKYKFKEYTGEVLTYDNKDSQPHGTGIMVYYKILETECTPSITPKTASPPFECGTNEVEREVIGTFLYGKHDSNSMSSKIYYHASGDDFEGQVTSVMGHPLRGNLTYQNKEKIFEGEFTGVEYITGNGKIQYLKTNNIYKGAVYKGMPHGKGEFNSGDGKTTYKGEFIMGILQGSETEINIEKL